MNACTSDCNETRGRLSVDNIDGVCVTASGMEERENRSMGGSEIEEHLVNATTVGENEQEAAVTNVGGAREETEGGERVDADGGERQSDISCFGLGVGLWKDEEDQRAELGVLFDGVDLVRSSARW